MAQTVSHWWSAGRAGADHMVVSFELLDPSGAPFRSSDSVSAPVYCTDASVQFDRARAVWGTATCQLLFPWDADQGLLDLLPTDPMAPLAPTSGVTFRLSAGFKNPASSDDEMVFVGRFDIEDIDLTESAAGVVVDIEGQDLTGRLDVADMPGPVDIPWGWRVLDSAKWLINQAIPWMVYQEDASDATTARVILDEQANRLTEINKALRSIGFECFMDPSGAFMHLRNIPTTADSANWVLDPDSTDLVNQMGQQQSRARVYNGVIVKGENPNSNDPPVRAVAWITDPSDPTYYIPGPPVQTQIGPRPFFFTSQYVRDPLQAQMAADSELRRIRGLLQRVKLETPTDPAVNVGDVVYIARDSVGVLGQYVVQSIAYSMTSGRMTVGCEERRV